MRLFLVKMSNLEVFSDAPWDFMRNMEPIEFLTLLYQSRVLLGSPLERHVLDPLQLLRCSLLTTSSQRLIKLSMKLPSSDIALEINSSAENLLSDHLMALWATARYITLNLQRRTLPILQVLLWRFHAPLCKLRDYYYHVSGRMILVFSSSPRFFTVSQRKKSPRKTT